MFYVDVTKKSYEAPPTPGYNPGSGLTVYDINAGPDVTFFTSTYFFLNVDVQKVLRRR